jgi:exosortase
LSLAVGWLALESTLRPSLGWKLKCYLILIRMASDILRKPILDLAALSRRSPNYALWIKTGLVAALMSILFGSVLIDMARDWWNEPAWSQGMLLPPLALYISWLNRAGTLGVAATPDRRGLLCITVACGLFILGKLASEFFMMRFAFVVVLAGMVWTFWGFGRLRTLAFPFLLLATMIPLPVMVYNSLAAPLQLLASDLATRIAQWIGVSVFRDGNIIQLAGVSLGVAEACSGLNSLSALVVGSLLLGYLLCSRPAARLALFAAAIPLAIGVNILRVAGTALLADYNQEFALGFYHAFSGWLVFVAGFGLLYLCARILHALLERERTA